MNVNSANMFNTLFIKTVKNTNKPIGTDGNNKPNFECIKCYEILLSKFIRLPNSRCTRPIGKSKQVYFQVEVDKATK